MKETHSKCKDIIYNELKLQEYLQPGSKMTIREKCFVFAARSRMLDIHANFKVGNDDIKCRKCRKSDEDQRHLLKCPELSDRSIVQSSSTISYEDLFCNDIKKVEAIGKVLESKLKQLKSDSKPTMCTDTNIVTCAASSVSQVTDKIEEELD